MPTTTITNLRCEYQVDPLGIDVPKPRLSWQMQSDRRGAYQSAYQLFVADSAEALARGEALLWDSGKVASDESVHVVYDGADLTSGQSVVWQVRVWDELGQMWDSSLGQWEMGLLDSSEWEAEWITPDWDEDVNQSQPSPLLRRKFDVAEGLVSARVYVTSLGLYRLAFNGEMLDDAVLTPGWSSYHRRLQYQTYDVTDLLTVGANVVGAILGDGWYRGHMGFTGGRNLYGEQVALLFQLVLGYENGRFQTITSDNQWRASTGPILMSDIYNGEAYDARLEKPGWSQSGYDDGDWQGVRQLDHSKNHIVAQVGPHIRRHEHLPPQQILTSPNGETILDFGQNLVGWVKIRARGKSGTTITLKHAEVLDSEGNLYTENLRLAKQTVCYTFKGATEEEEVYEPHFTFQGFRYVSVVGFSGDIAPENFTAVVVHSDTPKTGTFECSNPLINQLQHNIVWGQKGNFVDVPTDCPQRDERLGWTGDAQVFIRTACFNMDVATFFNKWLKDLSVDQLPNGSVPYVIPDVILKTGSGELHDADGAGAAAWGDAAVICPWILYLSYGDKQILAEQYDSMVGWVSFMQEKAGEDCIWRGGFQFGDWLDYRGEDARLPTPVTNDELIATAFFAYSTQLLSYSASILGKKEDAKRYQQLAQAVAQAFNDEFVTPSGRVGPNTQTAYVLALYFDLLPAKMRPLAAKRLADEIRQAGYHLTTGFVGTPYLCHVLSNHGYLDVAYKLLNQEAYPSWLYPVKQGATTIWERWDGIKPDGSFQDAGMNSFNHYAYGAVGDWLYQVVAGIDVDAHFPGYKRVVVRPQPGGGLTFAKASHDSVYGRIQTHWTKDDDTFTLSVTIPANCDGIVYLPTNQPKNIHESGKPVAESSGIREIRQENGHLVVHVGSGNYQFEVNA